MAAPKGNRYAAMYDDGNILEELIESLLDYAQNAKSIHLAPWCRAQGVSSSWLNDTAEHYPKLKEAMATAHELLSSKIANASFWDKESGCNASFGANYIGVYDKKFRDFLRFKAEIAKEAPSKEESKSAINQYIDQQKADPT